MRKTLFLLLAAAAILPVQAKVTLPAIFGDNMVLQQQQSVHIWGDSDQKEVTLTPSWNKAQTIRIPVTGGRWSARIQTPAGSFTPATLSIRDADSEVTLRNVLIGEVWVCSGQSNMYMPLRGYTGQPVEESMRTLLESPQYADRIRMITVGKRDAETPQRDLEGRWDIPSPQSAAAMSAAAYHFARTLTDALHVPIGIISTSWGGSKIETWMNTATLRKLGYNIEKINAAPKKPDARKHCSLIYNGLLAPIAGFTARGFTWYQGESNLKEAATYAQLMQAMVAQWRTEWDDTQSQMPFYYIQIAPYGGKDSAGTETPLLVEAQADALAMIPNSAMIPTTDLGNERCIHPAAKRAVGERLAATALGGVYGMKLPDFAALRAKTTEFKQGKAIVTFDNARYGLTPEGTPIVGFELAGSDGVFHPATGSIVKSKPQVEVTSEAVSNPTAVRYAFRNYTPTNLSNTLGWPAFPFRSDRK